MRQRNLEARVAALEAALPDPSEAERERVMAAFKNDLMNWIDTHVAPDPLASRAERFARVLWPDMEPRLAYRHFIGRLHNDGHALIQEIAGVIYEKEIKDR